MIMAKTETNDKRIKELKNKIESKLNNPEVIDKDFRTKLIFDFRNESYNLNVCTLPDLETLLIELFIYFNTINDIQEIDNFDLSDYTINSYKIEDLIHDVKIMISIRRQNEQTKLLKTQLSKLDALMSQEARTESLLDDIASLL